MTNRDPRAWLKEQIEHHAFLQSGTHRIVGEHGALPRWVFDFRRLIFKPEPLREIIKLFHDEIRDFGTVQIGGMETAAIPLITAYTLAEAGRGVSINGFYIRKSRKKSGLLNMIEGEVTADPIVLVDDLMNSGVSFLHQIKILEEEGKKVVAVCVILRYRDLSAYEELTKRGIRVISLFSLDDFKESLGLKAVIDTKAPPLPQPFEVLWRFRPPHPELRSVVPHSAPLLDDTHLYFGGDDGTFWCLRQNNGTVAWQFKVPFGALGKFIFSTPALYKDLVIFGAYDGNCYALDKTTGKRVWTYFDADWIGSSPAIADDLGLVFIGLEFFTPGAYGGIAALDAMTGEVAWVDRTMPAYTHASPAYSARNNMVLCGSNDGVMRAYDARTGTKRWELKTEGDIKYGVGFSVDETLAAFGSFDGAVYVLDTKTGTLMHHFPTQAAIYSTPIFDDKMLYVASLDKRLYCFDIRSSKTLWTFDAGARIFATPYIHEDSLYIGANSGRLHRLDKKTGTVTGVFQATERIVNAIAHSPKSGHVFLPTFANEIYCLKETKK